MPRLKPRQAIKLSLYACLAYFLFLSVPRGIQTVHAQVATVNRSPDCHWGLAAYGTEIVFSNWISYTSWGCDVFPDNTRWSFHNLQMGTGIMSGWWWISIQNGDITVTRFFESGIFEADLTGSSITMEMSCKMYETVEGADSYSWNDQVLTLTADKSGHIRIDFNRIVIPENPYLNEHVLPIYFFVFSLGMAVLPIVFMCYAIPRRQVSGANCIVLAFVSFIGFCLLMATREM